MSAESRIKSTLALIDGNVEGLIRRPAMYTGSRSFHEAENALTLLLSIRAELVGGDYNIKEYLREMYPQIPGPVRSISRYVSDDDIEAVKSFDEKHVDWIAESAKLVRWAMAEMGES